MTRRAACYIRRSTNEVLQADSLRVQEDLLRNYAVDNDIRIVAVYRDSASGRTANRPDFMKMVRTIMSGAKFELILARDVSRFGRFPDSDEGAYWSHLFEMNGVRTIYVDEMFTDDDSPLSGLVRSARRVIAAEFSRDRSRLITHAQERVTRLGFLRGGPPPFAMKRVLVTRDGHELQDLPAGTWKALSSHRTKLAPGEPHLVAVVHDIFERYAHGETAKAIAQRLTSSRQPTPGGRAAWSITTVYAILRNRAYAGRAVFTLRSRNGSSVRTLLPSKVTEKPGAYVPIIEENLWNAVQQRMKAETRNRSDEELAHDLRRAFEAVGVLEQKAIEPELSTCCWSTFQHRFAGGQTEALLLAYRHELEPIRSGLREFVESAGGVQLDEGVFEVGGVARLLIDLSFTRSTQWGKQWTIRVHEPADVVLGVGLSGQPLRVAEMCLIVARREVRRRVGVAIGRASKSQRHVVRSSAELQLRLRRVLFGTTAAEEKFIRAARQQGLVNLSVLARELGWGHHVVRRLYHRLCRRGCALPPLKYKSGRRIVVVCDGCGSTRSQAPNRALARKTTNCRSCTQARRDRSKDTAAPGSE